MIKLTLGYVSVVNQIATLNTEACTAHITLKLQRYHHRIYTMHLRALNSCALIIWACHLKFIRIVRIIAAKKRKKPETKRQLKRPTKNESEMRDLS